MTADKPMLSCAMTHDHDSSMDSLINGLPNNYKNKDGFLNRDSPHACAGEASPKVPMTTCLEIMFPEFDLAQLWIPLHLRGGVHFWL